MSGEVLSCDKAWSDANDRDHSVPRPFGMLVSKLIHKRESKPAERSATTTSGISGYSAWRPMWTSLGRAIGCDRSFRGRRGGSVDIKYSSYVSKVPVPGC